MNSSQSAELRHIVPLKRSTLGAGRVGFPYSDSSLIFVSKKHNGGYGDRLVGMCAAVTIARILDLKFFSTWENDFMCLCEENPYLLKNLPNGIDLNVFNQKRSSILEEEDILTNWSGKTILFQANIPVDQGLWKNPFLKERLTKSYEEETLESYKLIFSKYLSFKNILENKEFACGIQVRCGDTYCMPHSLAEQYIPENKFQEFAQSVKDYILAKGITGQVYLTSDARIMYSVFKEISDENIQFFYFDRDEDIHFDFYNSQNKYSGIIRDHMYLQQCKIVITGLRSNFGTTAAYASAICEKLVIYAKDFSFKEFDSKTELITKEFQERVL